MTQIVSRSGRLGNAPPLFDPRLDDRPGVVRPGAGLGMELNGAGALPGQRDPLDGAVVERDVGDLGPCALDREAVVLARDENAARRPVEDGVVRAAVAERQLVRAVPGGEREELVAEADAEDRHLPDEPADDGDLLRERRGGTGAG